MKVLMTGGTGCIGKELGIKLAGQGHEITVLSRSPKSYQGMLPYPCQTLAWKDFPKDKMPELVL